ncbi:hypothetical protein F511_27763 [Dorcoceras hygrometricum]|uniref:CCHC-type domain-containing protein n=1 Tax=Dorcoceras hygrometricum TaxID=472368 RepID=A0A2Z7B2P1_9LAMI|nr:hypothetical protein F511_27763 [Dorcoceras hygrometricum]
MVSPRAVEYIQLVVPREMPPRRRDRSRGQIPEESEGQNEEVQRSGPFCRRDRQVEDESVQSSQPPQQQVAQQSGHHRFRPRGRQFKKKSGSSSSGSGSSSSGSFKVEFCGKFGGRHPMVQCVVVQGSCNICGQYGNFARVCPLAGSQHTAAPPQDRGESSRGRSFPAPQQRLESLSIGRSAAWAFVAWTVFPTPVFRTSVCPGECHDEGTPLLCVMLCLLRLLPA